MSLASTTTVLRLLYYVNSRRYGNQPGPRESSLPLGYGEASAALFEPLGRPKRTLVLVHGVSGQASHDPHIVNLARSLVPLGYRSVIPELGGMARFSHDPRDIDTLVAAIDAAHRLDGHRISMLAFSYGASYALVAAADPRVRDACAALVGFGAYYDLGEALEHQRQLLLRCPDLEQDCADIAYLRYTLLSSHRDELGLSDEAWAAIDPILVNYTTRVPLENKRGPLLRYAKGVDYVALMESYQRRKLSPLLSPASTLHNVRCRVGLLHDPNDRFVPAHHAERIRSILDARPHVEPTEILTTPMLSHVQVDPMRRLLDLPRLVRLLEPALGFR
jgi:pimeloyl-ACP methyl ester carboxylesterase